MEKGPVTKTMVALFQIGWGKPFLIFSLMVVTSLSGQIPPGVMGGIVGGLTPTLMSMQSGPQYVSQLTQNKSMLRLDVLDSINRKLGIKFLNKSPNTLCNERRSFGFKTFNYCLHYNLVISTKDTQYVKEYPWGSEEFKLAKEQTFLRYGISALTGDKNYKDSYNLSLFLNSAYHQEVVPQYRNADSLFIPSPHHSQRGLWSRGFVSMGWATGYVIKDNPFAGSGEMLLVKWLLYAMDALFYAGVVSSVIGADNNQDIWRQPLYIKLGHAAFSYGIFTPLLSLELGETINLRRSGYRFPRELITDL